MRISDWSSDVCSSDLDATLAAVEIDEHARAALGAARPDIARSVAIGAFQLDHIGAQIGHDLRAVGPHQNRGEIEDADAFERAALFRSGLTHATAFCAACRARSRDSR